MVYGASSCHGARLSTLDVSVLLCVDMCCYVLLCVAVVVVVVAAAVVVVVVVVVVAVVVVSCGRLALLLHDLLASLGDAGVLAKLTVFRIEGLRSHVQIHRTICEFIANPHFSLGMYACKNSKPQGLLGDAGRAARVTRPLSTSRSAPAGRLSRGGRVLLTEVLSARIARLASKRSTGNRLSNFAKRISSN